MDCSPPGSSVHEILQARILDWVAISYSRGSARPRDLPDPGIRPMSPLSPALAGRFLTASTTWKASMGSNADWQTSLFPCVANICSPVNSESQPGGGALLPSLVLLFFPNPGVFLQSSRPFALNSYSSVVLYNSFFKKTFLMWNI